MRNIRILATSLAFALLPSLASASPEWRIAWGPEMAQEIDALALQGFRVETLVYNGPEGAALLQRECCKNRPALATYRLVGRDEAVLINQLGEQGYRLRSFAVDASERPLALFEKLATGPVGPTFEYRSVFADMPSLDIKSLRPRLEKLAAEGFRAVAASSRGLGAPDWIIVARRVDAGPREALLFDVSSAKELEKALKEATEKGYSVDTAWGRTASRFPLFGPERLAAIVSRPLGETRAVPTAWVKTGSDPDGLKGHLIAITRWRSKSGFVQSTGGKVYPRQGQIDWPDPEEVPTEECWDFIAAGLPGALFTHDLEDRSIGHAWVEWESAMPTGLHLRESDPRELLSWE